MSTYRVGALTWVAGVWFLGLGPVKSLTTLGGVSDAPLPSNKQPLP